MFILIYKYTKASKLPHLRHKIKAHSAGSDLILKSIVCNLRMFCQLFVMIRWNQSLDLLDRKGHADVEFRSTTKICFLI